MEFGPSDPKGDTKFPGVTIPDHELLCMIGRGSYGQVWMARSSMGHYRAVKIVQRSSFEHDRPFEREMEGIQKYEPISRSHPGLVGILHVGRSADGECFYYVMELGDDMNNGAEIDPNRYQVKNLATVVWDRGALSAEDCIELGLSLSDAIAFLHKHDLLHRDVKPANIIFVAGYPKLADIGLVTSVDSAGTYVGTEGFIPPEGPFTSQGDVYGLGKTLYEVVTGQDRNQFPTLPGSLVEKEPSPLFMELMEVINQACDSDIAKRYSSAREMHAEMTALANGKSIRRLRKLEERMLAMAGVLKIIGLGLVPLIFLGFALYLSWETKIAETNREIGFQEAKAAVAIEQGDYAMALRHVEGALDLAPNDHANSELQRLRLGSILDLTPRLTHLWMTDESVNGVVFSSDGETLLLVGDGGLAGSYSLRLRQYQAFTGHTQDVRAVDYDAGSHSFLTAGEGGVVHLWDAATGKIMESYHLNASLWTAKFSPDGKYFAVGGKGEGGTAASVWAIGKTDEPVMEIPSDLVFDLDFSPEGKYLAIASASVLSLWNIATREKVHDKPHAGRGYAVEFIDEGARLVTASSDGKYRRWNTQELSVEQESRDLNFAIRDLGLSPDGLTLATAGWDYTLRLWNLADGRAIDSLLRHSGRVNCVSFNREGNLLATGATDGSVRVWDLAGKRLPVRLPGAWHVNREGIRAIVREGELVAFVGGVEHTIPLLESDQFAFGTARVSRDGSVGAHISKRTNSAQRLDLVDLLSPTKVWVSEVVDLGTPIEFFDASQGKKRFLAAGGNEVYQSIVGDGGDSRISRLELKNEIKDIYYSDSGRMIVIQTDFEVSIRSSQDLDKTIAYIQTGNRLAHSAIDPSERFVVVAESDIGLKERSAVLYEINSGADPVKIFRHRDGVLSVSFHPSGDELMTASEDGTAVLRELGARQTFGTILRHRDQILDVGYGSAGKFVITSSSDRSVQIWDPRTAAPITPPIQFPWRMGFSALEAETGTLFSQITGRSLTWQWKLLPSDLPSEFLKPYISFLCGDQLDRDNELQASLMVWDALNEKFNDEVTVVKSEHVAWHFDSAMQALLELWELNDSGKNSTPEFRWFRKAEAFHREQGTLRNGEPSEVYESYRSLVLENFPPGLQD